MRSRFLSLRRVSPLFTSNIHTTSGSADVVVAGGGMVGSAAALAIAKLACFQSKNVVLLEAALKPETKPPGLHFSNRVSALNPSSVDVLDQVGAWQQVERVQPVHRMQVWDACSDAAIEFNMEAGGSPLNYIVENDLLVGALTGEMEKCPNLEIRYGARVKSYQVPRQEEEEVLAGDQVLINLEGGETLETDLLVGADGFRSLVRQSLGGGYMSWNYDQMGLVATLQLEDQRALNHTSWQRFLPSGPVALLPLTPGQSSLVWTLPAGEVKGLVDMKEENFVDLLNRALTSDQGQNSLVNMVTQGLGNFMSSFASSPVQSLPPPVVQGASGRAAFPLGFGHSTLYRGPRVVLVGDAAHRVHPLAGLGVNLGFGDVRELVEQVEASLLDGARLGHSDYLRQYETNRQRHNVPTMLGVDSIQKLYCSDFTPLVLARAVGLTATAACGPLSRAFKAHAAS